MTGNQPTDPPEVTVTCFNCDTDKDVGRYSFDLDLPQIVACPMCVAALSLGDEETLQAMRQPQRRKKADR